MCVWGGGGVYRGYIGGVAIGSLGETGWSVVYDAVSTHMTCSYLIHTATERERERESVCVCEGWGVYTSHRRCLLE